MQKGGVISLIDSNEAFNYFVDNSSIDQIISTNSGSGYIFSLKVEDDNNSNYYKFRGIETLDNNQSKKVTRILIKLMLTANEYVKGKYTNTGKDTQSFEDFDKEVEAQNHLSFSTPALFEPITPTVLYSHPMLRYVKDRTFNSISDQISYKLLEKIRDTILAIDIDKYPKLYERLHMLFMEITDPDHVYGQIYGHPYGIIAQELLDDPNTKFKLDLTVYKPPVPLYQVGTDEYNNLNTKFELSRTRPLGKELDTSLALYALITAASYGYMHCDFHAENIAITTNASPNTVFQCDDDTINESENTINFYKNKMTLNNTSKMESQSDKFRTTKVFLIDWGMYNLLNSEEKNKIIDLIKSFKDSTNEQELLNRFINIINFLQLQYQKYSEKYFKTSDVSHYSYTWLMCMNKKSTFQLYHKESSWRARVGMTTIGINKIAKNILFLLYGRERKEYVIQEKINKFIKIDQLPSRMPYYLTKDHLMEMLRSIAQKNSSKGIIQTFIKYQILRSTIIYAKEQEERQKEAERQAKEEAERQAKEAAAEEKEESWVGDDDMLGGESNNSDITKNIIIDHYSYLNEIPKDIEEQINDVLKKVKIDENDNINMLSPLTGMLGFFLAKCALLSNISLVDLFVNNENVKINKKITNKPTSLDGFFNTLYLKQDNDFNNSILPKQIEFKPKKTTSIKTTDKTRSKQTTYQKNSSLDTDPILPPSLTIKGGKKTRRKHKRTMRNKKSKNKSRKYKHNSKKKRI